MPLLITKHSKFLLYIKKKLREKGEEVFLREQRKRGYYCREKEKEPRRGVIGGYFLASAIEEVIFAREEGTLLNSLRWKIWGRIRSMTSKI